MPCQDSGPPREQETLQVIQAKLDRRTDDLCTVLRLMEATDAHQIKELPYELREWWREHKIEDRKRHAKLLSKLIVRLRDQISIDELEALDRIIEFATGTE